METNRHSHPLISYTLIIIFVIVVAVIIRTDGPKVVFNNGELVYSMPILVAFAFGGFGLFTFLFSFFCPNPMRKLLHIGGSFVVGLQYIFLIKNLLQYPDVFSWYHGILLAPYILFSADSYSTAGTIVTLVLPCIIIILSTLAIPVIWFYPNYFERFLDFLEARIQTEETNRKVAKSVPLIYSLYWLRREWGVPDA